MLPPAFLAHLIRCLLLFRLRIRIKAGEETHTRQTDCEGKREDRHRLDEQEPILVLLSSQVSIKDTSIPSFIKKNEHERETHSSLLLMNEKRKTSVDDDDDRVVTQEVTSIVASNITAEDTTSLVITRYTLFSVIPTGFSFTTLTTDIMF
jgi:hypothetical protein